MVVGALATILFAGPFAFSSRAQIIAPPPGPIACNVPGQVTQMGAWEQVKAPRFSAEPQVVMGFAVAVTDPNRLFVHNGVSLMRSFDGGCHWDEALTLGDTPRADLPVTRHDSRITEVTVSASNFTYVGIAQGENVPHILYSPDGGESWRQGGGLEAFPGGRPIQIVSPGSSPGILYALLDMGATSSGVSAGVSDTIAVTQDGGQSWTATSTHPGGGPVDLPIDLPPGTPIEELDRGFEGIAVNNAIPNDIWAYGGGSLFRSIDAGATFSQVEGVEGAIGVADVFSEGGPARVLAATQESVSTYVSTDDGQSFRTQSMPGVVRSIAPGPYANEFFVSTDAGVYQVLNGGTNDLSPPDRHGIEDIDTSFTATSETVYGHTAGTIDRYVIDFAPDSEPDPEFVPANICDDVADCEKIKQQLGELTPAYEKIVMRRGRTEVVDYHLSLDGAPTPLDVFFLIDVSGSMQEEINGIRSAMSDIANALASAGIEVEFGVGEYRSFTDDPAYDRLLDISPIGESLERALNELQARGGGDETQLEALFQVATGEGHEGSGFIESGLQANFRPGTLRVVINVTDEVFSEGGAHPSYEQVSRAMNGVDAMQVGLAIQTPVDTAAGPLTGDLPEDGLKRVATATGATAPEQGVDCDRDGISDIPEGDPLVCIIDPARSSEASVMAPAIVNTLKAVEDIGQIDLRVMDESGALTIADVSVVKDIQPRTHDFIDFKQQQELDFQITYICPPVTKTRDFPVQLRATDDGRPLAIARAIVRCTVPEESESPPTPAPLLLLPPIVPPPVRPPNPAPAPNPNPQNQPAQQPQAQAQGAMATQEQEQPQLAFATSGGPEVQPVGERVEEHEMSRYRDRTQEPGPELLYMAGALSMAFMFGWASVSRERIRTERVRR